MIVCVCVCMLMPFCILVFTVLLQLIYIREMLSSSSTCRPIFSISDRISNPLLSHFVMLSFDPNLKSNPLLSHFVMLSFDPHLKSNLLLSRFVMLSFDPHLKSNPLLSYFVILAFYPLPHKVLEPQHRQRWQFWLYLAVFYCALRSVGYCFIMIINNKFSI